MLTTTFKSRMAGFKLIRKFKQRKPRTKKDKKKPLGPITDYLALVVNAGKQEQEPANSNANAPMKDKLVLIFAFKLSTTPYCIKASFLRCSTALKLLHSYILFYRLHIRKYCTFLSAYGSYIPREPTSLKRDKSQILLIYGIFIRMELSIRLYSLLKHFEAFSLYDR